ncbi:MAG TPA: glycosyltransferase family 87 protein [Vicinamibacterales bacterium]|nr:glycosyltransferase family 87 protein [Vicinamibacterales bacterium]
MNSISTLEIRHRVAGPVIALGERVRGLARIVARIPWPRSARHATKQAMILATLLWIAAVVVSVAGSGNRGIAGPLKGADFVHFYTLGHLAASQQVGTIYNMKALHDAQVALVPESKPDHYPTVYPPQAALLFVPFAGWSYRTALLIWSVVTVALYALVVWSAWRPVSDQLSDRRLVIAAAAAFPAFWTLVVYGQITIFIVIAFWLGWLALERGRSYLAGAAFGLLALKPQFGIPLAAIVLACGEWRMLAGAVASVAVQASIIWLAMGWSIFGAYVSTLRVTLTYADWLESKPFMSHSLRAVTRLLPDAMGVPLWLTLSAIVLWYTVRVWRSDAPVRIRLGVAMLASLLVNPHVIVYDTTLLALPLLWFGAYMLEPERRIDAPAYGVLVYWLFAALFIPTAAAIGIQASVPLMMGMLVFMARMTTADSAKPLVDQHL